TAGGGRGGVESSGSLDGSARSLDGTASTDSGRPDTTRAHPDSRAPATDGHPGQPEPLHSSDGSSDRGAASARSAGDSADRAKPVRTTGGAASGHVSSDR